MNSIINILFVSVTITAITSIAFDISFVYGQVLTIEPPRSKGILLEDEAFVTFNATYWNGTTAVLDKVILNFELADEIVQFINEKISEERQELSEILEAEEEVEEEIEEDPDDNNDNGDNEPEPGPEPEPDPQDNNTEPIIEPPFEGGGEPAILTEGCSQGGYYSSDPNPVCYPIENGELQTEPDEDTAYCAALGCFFNPPAL